MLLDDRTVQRFLNQRGFYTGAIDGAYGPQSKAAARRFLDAQPIAFTSYSRDWNDERVRAGVEQAIVSLAGFDLGRVDGLVGARTQVALERYQDFVTFGRESPNPQAGVDPSLRWPRQRDMLDFYGEPGTNHTQIVPPYDVFYGDVKVRKITLNKRCAESGLRILERTLAEYGAERIHELGIDRYGGSYNNRTMRNGTTLSTHAFAAAWDWDPARNSLRETARTARFARPEYAAFIDAHESEGWISLGRARNFDWMHFQAARL